MPQIACLSPSPSARVTIYMRSGHSLLLLPKCVTYYYFRPANFTFDPEIGFVGKICNFHPDFRGQKVAI